MKQYWFRVIFRKPGDVEDDAYNGYVLADSEDQAYDKTRDLIEERYGWTNYMAIDIYKVED